MAFERACGVLLHPTCLPGPYGIGDIGPAAHRYLEWLSRAGARWWQVLPLNPAGPGASPYAATSTFAGNPALVSPELLRGEGLLQDSDLSDRPDFSPFTVEFDRVAPYKRTLLERAFKRFAGAAAGRGRGALRGVQKPARLLVRDWALFAALKQEVFGTAWWEWPAEIALRRPGALGAWSARHRRELAFEEFCQFAFFDQWERLRRRARALRIGILGDLPIYVADDSAEVWANRGIFRLDAHGRPVAVAGVPPDYFSETGQLWGNPLYDWEALDASGYGWWVARARAASNSSTRCGSITFAVSPGTGKCRRAPRPRPRAAGCRAPDASCSTRSGAALGRAAARGRGPRRDDRRRRRSARLLGLARDGRPPVRLPPAPRSAFLPYKHRRDQVVYTGTHDNNTTVGWFLGDASPGEKDFVCRYLGNATAARSTGT